MDPEELLARKEFYQLRDRGLPDDEKQQFWKSVNDGLPSIGLKFDTHQILVKNLLNPTSKIRCILAFHGTGTGKTIASLCSAMEFIRYNRVLYEQATRTVRRSRRMYYELDHMTPSVFVLGFMGVKMAFMRELTTHPEFGFISVQELEKFRYGDNSTKMQIYTQVRKRILNKSKGGFFKFYGYDEIINRTFITNNVDLTKFNSSKDLVADIDAEIASGNIRVDREFMKLFTNSLIIADEIHNTYNGVERNNRGVFLLYLLKKVKSLHAIILTATTGSNVPRETINAIEYLRPDEKLDYSKILKSKTQFAPNFENYVCQFVAGHISFVQDLSTESYPQRILMAEKAIIPRDVLGLKKGDVLPFLNLVQVETSSELQQCINQIPADRREAEAEILEAETAEEAESLEVENLEVENVEPVKLENRKEILGEVPEDSEFDPDENSVPADGYIVYDMCYPTPDGPDYRSKRIRQKIAENPEFIAKNNIQILPTFIKGNFLQEPLLSKYSPKYSNMLKKIMDLFRGNGGNPMNTQKIMIYHNRVRMSGVAVIYEILLLAGFIPFGGEATDDTICMVCGNKKKQEHVNHDFIPVRVALIHNEIERSQVEKLMSKFNSPSNIRGHECSIFIGSKIVKESYDFKAVQHMFIMSIPINIPTLMQIMGRCVRKFSHNGLPAENQKVHIYLYAHVANNTALDPLSPELNKYVVKVVGYRMIQKLESVLIQCAIDADLNYNTTHAGKNSEGLGYQVGEPKFTVPKNLSENPTYIAYEYSKFEREIIAKLIKRAFLISPVYKIDDLFNAIQTKFQSEINPKTFSRDNFIIVLNSLVDPLVVRNLPPSEFQALYRMKDPLDVYIYKGAEQFCIRQVGDYLTLVNVANGATLDIGLYTTARTSGPVLIKVAEYMESLQGDAPYRSRVEKIRESPPEIAEFLQYPLALQIAYIRANIIDSQKSPIMNTLNLLGAILTYEYIYKYKDAHTLFAEVPPMKKFGGYCLGKSVFVYSGSKFVEVNRLIFNLHYTWKENDILIGIIDAQQKETKFKIRRPMQQIQQKLTTSSKNSSGFHQYDTRQIERGIVCKTKTRNYLLGILEQFGVKILNTRVGGLCDSIFDTLLARELKERQEKTRLKFMYGWWDEQPTF